MKKAFDQTVRDLKRGVNKKVLKVPGIEQKILDATSNEPWGPHGTHLADLAHATRNYHECQMIMNVIWKRLNDTGKNWRHVYKALTVLEYMVGHGAERVIDEIREHAYQISTLSDFQYLDSGGRDQGANVRRKSQSLVALVNDKERVQEVRQKAAANRDKYRSAHSTGGRLSSYSGGGGYDDDRYEGRYGNRDEDRNGYGRDRDGSYRDEERYGRGGDPYSRDGDRYGRDSDERYGRESYKDDDYKGRSSDDNQFGPRNKSFDRDRDRSFEDDDRYSSRSGGGGRVDNPSPDDSITRRLERKLSEPIVGAPPSYEEVARDSNNRFQDERVGGNGVAPATKATSPAIPRAGYPESPSPVPSRVVTGAPAMNKGVDSFDEFDPRGSAFAAPAAASGSQVDLFGSASDLNSLALVPVTPSTTEADMPTDSGFGTSFVALSSASTVLSQPNEDPFGDAPFKATGQGNFPAQQQSYTPATSFQPSGSVGGAAPKVGTTSTFDFGGSLGGLTYTSNVANGQSQFAADPQFMPNSGFPTAPGSNDFGDTLPPSVSADLIPPQPVQQPAAPTSVQATNMSYLLQSIPSAPQHAAQPRGTINQQTAPMNLPALPSFSSQPASQVAFTASGPPANNQQQKDKFETKSTVWTDTLNRGLVNLNISGAKINPLADIGIDFDSINRLEKRKERSSAAPATSTINMGKAMGSGSGIGRAGAGGLAAPPNPTMGSGMGMGSSGGMGRGMGMGSAIGGGGVGMGMGMGMTNGMNGYGMGMNQPMGNGYGMGMNQPMGMNMGMGIGPGAQMRPGPGIPGGSGYNPMMGMGTYSSQQPYGGGYR